MSQLNSVGIAVRNIIGIKAILDSPAATPTRAKVCMDLIDTTVLSTRQDIIEIAIATRFGAFVFERIVTLGAEKYGHFIPHAALEIVSACHAHPRSQSRCAWNLRYSRPRSARTLRRPDQSCVCATRLPVGVDLDIADRPPTQPASDHVKSGDASGAEADDGGLLGM